MDSNIPLTQDEIEIVYFLKKRLSQKVGLGKALQEGTLHQISMNAWWWWNELPLINRSVTKDLYVYSSLKTAICERENGLLEDGDDKDAHAQCKTTYIICKGSNSVWKSVWIRLKATLCIPRLGEPAVIHHDIFVSDVVISITDYPVGHVTE